MSRHFNAANKISRRVGVTASGGGGGTALATMAASMSAGQWAQMSPAPTGLSLFTGTVGSAQWWVTTGLAIDQCYKFAKDATNKKMYLVSGDHNAQSQVFTYDEATNAWSATGSGMGGSGNPDHGYGHIFVDSTNAMWHNQAGANVLSKWNGSSFGTTINYIGAMAYANYNKGMAFFPEAGANGRVIIFQVENGTNGSLLSIDPVTSSIQTLVDGDSSSLLSGTGTLDTFAEYSAARQLVYFGGGSGSSKVWTINASQAVTANSVTTQATTPAGITTLSGAAGPGANMATINVSNGNLVGIASSSVWHELTPGTGWSSKGGTVSMLSSNTYDGSAFGVASCPYPEYGVVVFMKNWAAGTAAQMWLWKSS